MLPGMGRAGQLWGSCSQVCVPLCQVSKGMGASRISLSTSTPEPKTAQMLIIKAVH
jgi:hypothetical protein